MSVVSTWMGAFYNLQNGGSVVTMVSGILELGDLLSKYGHDFIHEWRWLLSGMMDAIEEMQVIGHQVSLKNDSIMHS
jgi:hypothetical protein